MERNTKIDYIRACAIFFVVLGHSIQFGSGSEYQYLEDSAFKFIYSFHMPLFMLLSGYLFYHSLRKHKFIENVCSRFRSLFIPIIMWKMIPFMVYIYRIRPNTVKDFINAFLLSMIDNSWFLWAIFYCSFVVLIVNRLFNDHIAVYLLGLLLTFIIPDSHNIKMYTFMYPYFIIGYFYHKYAPKIKEKYNSIIRSWQFICLIAIIFGLLLHFYNTDSYIYTTGYSLLNKNVICQLGIDLYRFTIGMIGSCFIVLLLLKVYSLIHYKRLLNFLMAIGINSLGIYMISGLIFQYLLPRLTSELSTINYLLTICEFAIITLISLFISFAIKKYPITNLLFFGGRK